MKRAVNAHLLLEDNTVLNVNHLLYRLMVNVLINVQQTTLPTTVIVYFVLQVAKLAILSQIAQNVKMVLRSFLKVLGMVA